MPEHDNSTSFCLSIKVKVVYKDTNIKAVTDTTIINRGYSFENGNNDYKAYFSEDSSKGLLLVEKDGEEIRLVPNGIQSVGTVGQIESDMELVDSFEYAGVYGTDSVLRFLPQLNGCKEEIVLSSYQGISDFSFTLYTQEGTIAAINSKGEGYTQIEITEKLGFKNSSAVSKRLAKIKQLFTEYAY